VKGREDAFGPHEHSPSVSLELIRYSSDILRIGKWHGRGRRFEPDQVHHFPSTYSIPLSQLGSIWRFKAYDLLREGGVWFSLKTHGTLKYGRLIEQNIEQTRYLASLIKKRAVLAYHSRKNTYEEDLPKS